MGWNSRAGSMDPAFFVRNVFLSRNFVHKFSLELLTDL